jgi:TM2 domain-containing membrane protein YozV
MPYMSFCRSAINYDPALPPADSSFPGLRERVKRQDSAAATMYFYHLAGLGLEAWDYQRPDLSDDFCIRSMWRLVCFTYFPRAPIGCEEDHVARYIRPCQSSCQNYVRHCGVECCDESVRCVFTHTKNISRTEQITTAGYAPHDGPSSLCTGSGRLSAVPHVAVLGSLLLLQSPRSALAVALASAAVVLQGCEFDVPTHTVGKWRQEEDYLIKYEFVPPGSSPADAVINSCGLQRLSQTLQCSGRGVCKMWQSEDMQSHTSFCECDRDWADPECGTPRDSQAVAFGLSLILGPFGADHFYLGSSGTGLVKLLTLGGGGIWWIYDVIRIGSAPVYSSQFRVAADLPHWVFVLATVALALTIGFVAAYFTTTAHVANLRKEQMIQHAEEEAHLRSVAKQEEDARWDRARRMALGVGVRSVPGKAGWPSYEVNYGTVQQPPGPGGPGMYPSTMGPQDVAGPIPDAVRMYANEQPHIPLGVRAYASEFQGKPPTSSFNL